MSTTMARWVEICGLQDIPPLGARIVPLPQGDIAIFRCGDDQVFALRNSCPHKQGPLSEGIIHGHRVTCPLHGWVIDLEMGAAVAPDVGCVPKLPLRVTDGTIWLALPDPPAKASPAG